MILEVMLYCRKEKHTVRTCLNHHLMLTSTSTSTGISGTSTMCNTRSIMYHT